MKWDDRIVCSVAGDSRYFVVNPKSGIISELSAPDSSSIVVLSKPQSRRAAMLCRKDGEEYVWAHDSNGWKGYSIPKNFDFGDNCVLIADHRRIVIIEYVQEQGGRKDYLSIFEQGKWSIRIDVTHLKTHIPWERVGNGKQYLLQDSILYVGIDEGEWGGVLMGVNLNTMQLLQRPEDADYLARQRKYFNPFPDTLTASLVVGCVQSLILDCQGSIWVSTGLAHMMHKSGGIYTGNRLQWQKFASVVSAFAPSSSQPSLMERDRARRYNWSGALCSFDQLTLDEYGIPYLITRYPQYVYTYKEGSWYEVLPMWLLQQSEILDLIVQNNCMYLATTNAGVLVWDIPNQKVTQFLVPESS